MTKRKKKHQKGHSLGSGSSPVQRTTLGGESREQRSRCQVTGYNPLGLSSVLILLEREGKG